MFILLTLVKVDGHFADFGQVKIDGDFANFKQFKIMLFPLILILHEKYIKNFL